MDKEVKNHIIGGIVCLIIGLLISVKDTAFLIEKGETIGIIQSDGYMYTEKTLVSRYPKHVYAVKYQVNGVEYNSTQYVSEAGYYNKGTQVTVWYDKENPEKLFEAAIPISGIMIVFCGIAVLILAVVKMK